MHNSPDTFHKISIFERREGLRHATHIQKQKLSQVYLYAQRALSFLCGRGYLHQHDRRISGVASLGTKVAWPKAMLFFSYGDILRNLSIYRPYHSIYMRSEDESSLPSQKSIVTCCNGCGRKGISTWCLPCYKGWTYRTRVRYAKKPGDILIYIYPTRCNVTQFILSGNWSTCFGWYHHSSSGAQTTVSTTSGICHTVIAICRTPPTAHSNRFQLFHDSGR